MNKLLLGLVVIAGTVAGGAVGFVLKPEEHKDEEVVEAPEPKKEEPKAFSYVRLDRQFVVPIIVDREVKSLVVLELSLEIGQDATERVFAKEPRVRDALLAQLHRTAQEGGFLERLGTGTFLAELREDLLTSLDPVLGDDVHGVLIGNIVRRDV